MKELARMEGRRGTQAKGATRQLKKNLFGDNLEASKRRSTAPIETRALTLVSASDLRWPDSCNMGRVIPNIVATMPTSSGFVCGETQGP